jgi:hypothetical protein
MKNLHKMYNDIVTEKNNDPGFDDFKKTLKNGLLKPNSLVKQNGTDAYIVMYKTPSGVTLSIYRAKGDSDLTIDYNSSKRDDGWSVKAPLKDIEKILDPYIVS